MNLHLGCTRTARTRVRYWIGFVLFLILWLRLSWWSPCSVCSVHEQHFRAEHSWFQSLCSHSYFQEFLCWQTWLQTIPHFYRFLNKEAFYKRIKEKLFSHCFAIRNTKVVHALALSLEFIKVLSVLELDYSRWSFNSFLCRLTIAALGEKLNDYWNEMKTKKNEEYPLALPVEEIQWVLLWQQRTEHTVTALSDMRTLFHVQTLIYFGFYPRKQPDQTWVQCDACLKWRKLPDGIEHLPEKWYCSLNPDPQFR